MIIKKPTKADSNVQSSASSPIDRWLDVFVPLLNLPKARASEIRAELEDHLRARVDDLMVTGTSEPEAVRKAVAELGETAELAKQFRTATQPPRRTLMHALILACAGGAIAIGSMTIGSNQSVIQPAVMPGLQPAPAAVAIVAGVGSSAAPHDEDLYRYELMMFRQGDREVSHLPIAGAITDAIYDLVLVPAEMDGDAQLKIVSNTLFVRGPQKVQDGVAWVLASLEESAAESREAAERMEREAELMRKHEMNELRIDLQRYTDEIIHQTARVEELGRMERINFQDAAFAKAEDFQDAGGEAEQKAALKAFRADLNEKIAILKNQMIETQLALEDATAYRSVVRDRLIDMEHPLRGAGTENQTTQTTSPSGGGRGGVSGQ